LNEELIAGAIHELIENAGVLSGETIVRL